MSAAAVLALGCSGARAPAPLTVDNVMGAWSGTMTHEGDERPFAIELEPGEEGKVALRLTIPEMNLSRLPAGSIEPRIEGRELTLGPFVFTHDATDDTLSGIMPAGMVPGYEVPVTLRRVATVEPLDRPEPSAPLVEPAWSFEAGVAA
jgi:hypothetical protein